MSDLTETAPTRPEAPDVAELRRLLEGSVCEARFSDGAFHGAACGLEGCECPEHEWEAENPTPAGTYLTLRLADDAPVRLGALWALIAPDVALDLAEALDALRAELAHMTEARDNARAEVERLTALVAEADEPHPDRPNCTTVGGKGVRVTATDLETGESGSVVIDNDYVLICAGDRYQSGVQRHTNGTTVLTVKVRKRLAALDGEADRD